MRRSVLCLALLIGVAGCGKKSSSPVTPTTTVTTASVSITTTADMLTIGEAVAFTASATMSDGTTRTITPAWVSSSAGVATVDAAGTVRGIGSGQTTITITYDSRQATRTIRVVPDYGGSWSGEYAVTSCQDSGGFASAGWCAAAPAGSIARLTMILTQTRDTVTGTWTHDRMTGATQGTVEVAGTLVLAGSGSYEGTAINITGWRSVTTDNRNQTGQFTMTFTSPTWSGSAQAAVEIRTCTKQ